MKKAIPSDVWETKRALIAKLYKDEEWPLKQVIKQIRTDDFNPSETQLRSRLKKWRVTKPSRQARKKVIDDHPRLSGESSGSEDSSPGMSAEPAVMPDTPRRGRTTLSGCKLHYRSAKNPETRCRAIRVDKRLPSPCETARNMTLERAFSPPRSDHQFSGHQTSANTDVSPPFSQSPSSTAPAASYRPECVSLGPAAGRLPAAPLLESPTYTASGYTMSPDISGASSPAEMWAESTASPESLVCPAVIDSVDIGPTYALSAAPLWYPVTDESTGQYRSAAPSFPVSMAGYHLTPVSAADQDPYVSQSQASFEDFQYHGMEDADDSMRLWRRGASSSADSDTDCVFVQHANPYFPGHKFCSAAKETPQIKHFPSSTAGTWSQHAPYHFATPYAMTCASPAYNFPGQQDPLAQHRARVPI